MKKFLTIALIVIVVCIAVFFIGGSVGKKEVKNQTIHPVSLKTLEDGEYLGSFAHVRWEDTVVVTIKDHRIVDIERIEPSDGTKQSVIDELTRQIITNQDICVDTVSGASVNSKAFLKAVENALIGEQSAP